MPRLKLVVAYTGTHFQGWQVQPGARTVQGCLEEVLGRICSQPIRVHGAGRTDSGVHALGQVAHTDIPAARRDVPWLKALNRLLPKDMAVRQVQEVPSTFHAQYNALGKEYIYTLCTNPDYVLPQRRPFVWWVKNLDVARMQDAATHLQGARDFAAFQNVGTPLKSTVRHLHAIHVLPRAGSDEVDCHFVATGFLKQMVRNLMAALIAVGREKMDHSQLRALLAGKDRRQAPATAPARGLTLARVFYSQPEQRDSQECVWT